MAQNPNKTKMDWNTALKNCVDAEHDALRVLFSLAEMQMELDGEDGDSVLSLPNSATFSEGEVDAKRFKRGQLFAQGSVRVEVSPVDEGDVWLEIAAMNPQTLSKSPILELCCRRIRLIKAEGARAYFVVQS